jgi:hypothetical protein
VNMDRSRGFRSQAGAIAPSAVIGFRTGTPSEIPDR